MKDNPVHIMLDLETLGNRINPVIVQISAVAFTLDEGALPDEFDILVSRESCEYIGLQTCPDTIKWWSEQSEEARELVFGEYMVRYSIEEALTYFTEYVEDLNNVYNTNRVYIWGNGIRADNVWLLSAYKALDMQDPISYCDDLDYRTLHYLSKKKTGVDFKKETEFTGVQHNAIDDCHHQIKCAVRMWEAINN